MTEKVKRIKNVLVDAEIRVDINIPYYSRCDTIEGRAKYLLKEADAFNDFIKDHRSQDHIRLYVDEVYEDQCSFCHNEWETLTDVDGVFCANCGNEVGLELQ